MTEYTQLLAMAAAATLLATNASAQAGSAARNTPTATQGTSAPAPSAKAYRGASPYVAVANEAPPRLIVDAPLAEGLPLGVYWAQYRVENLRIVPVFGAAARQVSPRVGHLHVIVDDLPWWWADASDNNTVDIANLPPGPHKVTIQLVDPDHNVFPGQQVTHNFVIPARTAAANAHGEHARPGTQE